MRTISATKFKKQRLSLLDQAGPDGLVITKHGKPIAKLISVRGPCEHLIGSMKGEIKIKGDILSTGLKWNAQRSR